MSYNVLQIVPNGEGHTQFTLGDVTVELVTRYNYSASAWSMDVLDINGNLMAGGLMLTPLVNLLQPYPDLTVSIGGLMLVEAIPDSYLNPDNLGSSVQLLWFPVGSAVAYP